MRIDLDCLFALRAKARSDDDGLMHVLRFCMSLGLIASEYECPKCGKQMKLKDRAILTDGFEWTCRSKKAPSHHVTRSVRSGTWFSESKLPIVDILLMTEFFVRGRTQKDVMYELNVSEHTVCDWRRFFREVCVDFLVHDSEMIGGPGKYVEIEEKKFVKSKYNRGKRVEGQWVFGGVERGSNKCFLRVVERGDKDTLLEMVKTWILPGTTILSDCWQYYDTQEDEAFLELTVNHSLYFKDTESGVHANSIEGSWSSIKKNIPNGAVIEQFEGSLAEYLWRRCQPSDADLMANFLSGIKRVYPPHTRDPSGSPDVDH